MTDPRRLIDEGATAFETDLLREGRRDAIAEDGRRRILSGLGLGSAILTATTVAGAMGVTKSAPVAAAGGAVIKYVGICAVGALATWGGVSAWHHFRAPSDHAVSSPEPALATGESSTGVDPVVGTEVEATEVAPVIAPASPARAAPSAAPVRRSRALDAPSERAKDSLPKELASLDSARRALANDNPALALRLLDGYESLFPSGRLGTEATVLRIESLALSGNRAGVAAAGKEFLARHPNGPYATRVRSLMADPSRPAPDSSEKRR